MVGPSNDENIITILSDYISSLNQGRVKPDELQPTAPLPIPEITVEDIAATIDPESLLLPHHHQVIAFLDIFNSASTVIDSMKMISGKYGDRAIELEKVPGGSIIKQAINTDRPTFNDLVSILIGANALDNISNNIDIDDALDNLNNNPLGPSRNPCELELKNAKQRLYALKASNVLERHNNPQKLAEVVRDAMSQTTVGPDILYYDVLNQQLHKTLLHLRSVIIEINDSTLESILSSDDLIRYRELEEEIRTIMGTMSTKLLLPTPAGHLTPALSSIIIYEPQFVRILKEMYELFIIAPVNTSLKIETFTKSIQQTLNNFKLILDQIESSNTQTTSDIQDKLRSTSFIKTDPLGGTFTIEEAAGQPSIGISAENIVNDRETIHEDIEFLREEDLFVARRDYNYKVNNRYGSTNAIERSWKQLDNTIARIAEDQWSSFTREYTKKAESFAKELLSINPVNSMDSTFIGRLSQFNHRLGEGNLFDTFFGLHKKSAAAGRQLASNMSLNSLATLWNFFPDLTCIIKWLVAQVCLSRKPLADIDQYCEILESIENMIELASFTLAFKSIDLKNMLKRLLNDLAGKVVETIVSMLGNTLNHFINRVIRQIRKALDVDDQCSGLQCLPFEQLIHEILDIAEDKRDDILRWLSDFFANMLHYDAYEEEMVFTINKHSKLTKLLQLIRELRTLCEELAEILKLSPQAILGSIVDQTLQGIDTEIGIATMDRAREVADNAGIDSEILTDNVVSYNSALRRKQDALKILNAPRVYGRDQLQIKSIIDQFDPINTLLDVDGLLDGKSIPSGSTVGLAAAPLINVPEDLMDYYRAHVEYKRASADADAYTENIRGSGLSLSFFKGMTAIFEATNNDKVFNGVRYSTAPTISFDACFCGEHKYTSNAPDNLPIPRGDTPPITGELNELPIDLFRNVPDTNSVIGCEEQLSLVESEIANILAASSKRQG